MGGKKRGCDTGKYVGNIPYYPIIAEANLKRYEQYRQDAELFGNIILCGWLSEYKYYNMDVCILWKNLRKIKQDWSA